MEESIRAPQSLGDTSILKHFFPTTAKPAVLTRHVESLEGLEECWASPSASDSADLVGRECVGAVGLRVLVRLPHASPSLLLTFSLWILPISFSLVNIFRTCPTLQILCLKMYSSHLAVLPSAVAGKCLLRAIEFVLLSFLQT